MAASKRGLQTGLKDRTRTVILMLDETIVTETPPLYARYGPVGGQTELPISGNRSKRILHGAINIVTGEVALLVTTDWDADTHQAFLRQIRAHWRGWHIILFEDRGPAHTAAESRALAKTLGLEVRWLPRATPELNAMDQLWKHVKTNALANQPTQTIDRSAEAACQYVLHLTQRERLRKAGILSGRFWLAKVSKNF
jgi:transposase